MRIHINPPITNDIQLIPLEYLIIKGNREKIPAPIINPRPTNNKSFKDEYSIAHNLYQLRKQGVNFFRNSFDYISALDKNAAIIHYKPSQESSQKLSNQSLLLLDSGAHYLEGTPDVTRVIKFNKF